MRFLLAIILGTALITSCRKVIDVNLNETDPVTVIEANYSAEDSTVRVLVSKTTSYFDNTTNMVNDALITITDQAGGVQTIPLVSNGLYELTGYVPQFNTTYTITVSQGGEMYTATAYLHDAIPQEPIFYEYIEEGFFGGEGGYLAYVSYNDPIQEGDYFFVEYTRNDTLGGSFQNDDLLTNGNLVNVPLFQEFFKLGDTVEIELRTIDKKVFKYNTEIEGATDTGGAAPANPTYQWTNRALGYFSAHASSRQSVVIQ